jgi:uncharacterized protein (TIGR02996 family)
MSSDLAGLLEAIRERPDEDLPRLALADWCMEQPDPLLAARGEFIQLRCRAAGLDLCDDQRSRLEHRARQLREQHERAWLGTLAEVVDGWDFERGLVLIELREGFHTRSLLKRLAKHTEWLWVIGVKGLLLNALDLRRLIGSPLAGQLTSLDLTDCEIGLAGAQFISRSKRLARLTRLRLGYSQIGDKGAAALAKARLPRLVTLDLSHNIMGLPGARAIAACTGLDSLLHLALNGCRLGDRGALTLVHSTVLNRLDLLELADNNLSDSVRAELRERFGERVRM